MDNLTVNEFEPGDFSKAIDIYNRDKNVARRTSIMVNDKLILISFNSNFLHKINFEDQI